MLAMLLAQIKLRGVEDITEELDFLLDSGDGLASVAAVTQHGQNHPLLSPDQVARLESFAKHAIFKPVERHIIDHEVEWMPFLESSTPETCVPTPWEPSTGTCRCVNHQ
jgi:dynein heavy chain 1, cytosolic